MQRTQLKYSTVLLKHLVSFLLILLLLVLNNYAVSFSQTIGIHCLMLHVLLVFVHFTFYLFVSALWMRHVIKKAAGSDSAAAASPGVGGVLSNLDTSNPCFYLLHLNSLLINWTSVLCFLFVFYMLE